MLSANDMFNSDIVCHVIADEENYRIKSYSQGSSIIFITFNTTRTTKESAGFGVNFCLSKGFDVISVSQDNDTQYQFLSREKFLNIIAPYIKGKDKVVCYGSSLGGYCALYYGGAIDCKIIAASPKNSAHPDFKLKKYECLEFKHDLKMPASENKAFVVYDPKRGSDRLFIDELVRPAFKNAEYLDLPFAGHAVLHYIKDVGKLKSLILNITYNNNFPDIQKNVPTDNFLYNKSVLLYKKGCYEKSLKLLSKIKVKRRKVLALREELLCKLR